MIAGPCFRKTTLAHITIVLFGLGAPPLARASEDEAALGREARLEPILRVALSRNVSLSERALRARAAATRGAAATRLPDPELKYEQWGVPLRRPLALREAEAMMLGLRQGLPAWGTRDARRRMAEEDAGAAREEVRAARRDLVADVRRAHADYARTDHELGLHREHVALTTRLVELARLNYQAGRGTQQDILRIGLELSRMHADLARIEQEKRSSAALLNAMMDRPSDAALGPAPPPVPPPPLPEEAARSVGIDDRRPEIAASARAVRRSEAAVELARREARLPSLMLGVDYMYMPMLEEARHGYGAMVSMSLPWLSAGRRAGVDEAEETLRADRQALAATRVAARLELEDALARLAAARASFAVVERDLMPQAARALEATQAAFAVGKGDAVGLLDSLRSYLQVRVERLRAVSRIATAAAGVERAAGREVTP